MKEHRKKWNPEAVPGQISAVTLAFLLLILAYAAFVRLHNLRENPGWYADEGSDVDIATHLMGGQQQYFAVGQSTLVAARLPLFHLFLASLFSLFGRDILILRVFTALYGILNTLLLFLWGRHLWNTRVALLAAALYAIYPEAVLNSRFGFFYNQLAFLHLALFYTLWRFLSGGSHWWLVAACLSVSLSLVTSVSSLPIIGFVVVSLLLTPPSRLWWAIPLMASAPVLYGAWMAATTPNAFFYDLQFTFTRVGGSLLAKPLLAVWNYMHLLRSDVWFALGAFGLTRLPGSPSRLYTNLFFWYALLTTAAGAPRATGVGYHYVIPLLPWVAIGLAAFVIWAVPRLLAELEALYNRLYAYLPWVNAESRGHRLLRRQGQLWTVGLILFWMLISPLFAAAIEGAVLPRVPLGEVALELAQVTVPNVEDAESAVAYVNQHAAVDDLVLAPPHVAWLLETDAADYQQSVAYSGGETQNYPDDMDRNRFLFDCSVENARYALLWEGWREWAGGKMPDLDELFQVIEGWPVVYEKGDWRVYANPEAQDRSH